MTDHRLDMLELESTLRAVVSECELTGKRSFFLRGERTVAVLISHDEYLALRETVVLADRHELRKQLEERTELGQRGDVLLPEDLFVE